MALPDLWIHTVPRVYAHDERSLFLLGQGHEMRCSAIKEEWEARGGRAELLFAPPPGTIAEGAVYLVDGLGIPAYDLPRREGIFVAKFDDFGRVTDADLVINYSSHADSPYGLLDCLYRDLDAIRLVGFEYYPLRNDFRGLKPEEGDPEVITLVPGSAPFLSTEFAARLESTLVPRRRIRRLDGLKGDEFARELARASIVLTSASGTALESCHLGKPTVLVQTAINQFYLHMALVSSGAAIPFTLASLARLASDAGEQARLGSRACSLVPPGGRERIVDSVVAALEASSLWEKCFEDERELFRPRSRRGPASRVPPRRSPATPRPSNEEIGRKSRAQPE
ncbi:MAG: hypothetical protein HY720_16070 [Planctomycetes bacterium]|nr:hypothetical protein [Planctomycetota bacterium]